MPTRKTVRIGQYSAATFSRILDSTPETRPQVERHRGLPERLFRRLKAGLPCQRSRRTLPNKPSVARLIPTDPNEQSPWRYTEEQIAREELMRDALLRRIHRRERKRTRTGPRAAAPSGKRLHSQRHLPIISPPGGHADQPPPQHRLRRERREPPRCQSHPVRLPSPDRPTTFRPLSHHRPSPDHQPPIVYRLPPAHAPPSRPLPRVILPVRQNHPQTDHPIRVPMASPAGLNATREPVVPSLTPVVVPATLPSRQQTVSPSPVPAMSPVAPFVPPAPTPPPPPPHRRSCSTLRRRRSAAPYIPGSNVRLAAPPPAAWSPFYAHPPRDENRPPHDGNPYGWQRPAVPPADPPPFRAPPSRPPLANLYQPTPPVVPPPFLYPRTPTATSVSDYTHVGYGAYPDAYGFYPMPAPPPAANAKAPQCTPLAHTSPYVSTPASRPAAAPEQLWTPSRQPPRAHLSLAAALAMPAVPAGAGAHPHMLWDISQPSVTARRITPRGLVLPGPVSDHDLREPATSPPVCRLEIAPARELGGIADVWGPIVVERPQHITVYDVYEAIYEYFQACIPLRDLSLMSAVDAHVYEKLVRNYRARCRGGPWLADYEIQRGIKRIDWLWPRRMFLGVATFWKNDGTRTLRLESMPKVDAP